MMMALVLVLLPTMDTCTLRSAGSRRGQSPCLRWPARMAGLTIERVGRGPSSPTTSLRPLWRLARPENRSSKYVPGPFSATNRTAPPSTPDADSAFSANCRPYFLTAARPNGRPPCLTSESWLASRRSYMIQLPQYDRVARVASSSVSWLLVKKAPGAFSRMRRNILFIPPVCAVSVCECYMSTACTTTVWFTLTALSNQNGVCSGVIYTQGIDLTYLLRIYVRPIHTTAAEKPAWRRNKTRSTEVYCAIDTLGQKGHVHEERAVRCQTLILSGVQRARHRPLTWRVYRQLTYRWPRSPARVP